MFPFNPISVTVLEWIQFECKNNDKILCIHLRYVKRAWFKATVLWTEIPWMCQFILADGEKTEIK